MLKSGCKKGVFDLSLRNDATQNPTDMGSRRSVVFGFLALAIIALAAASYGVLTSYFVRSEQQNTPQRAAFFARAMDDALTRLEHLPFVLSIDPITLDALKRNDVTDLNPILASIATRARAEFVYVLDINGQTIASSNYNDPDSLVGNHYTFRPYFRDAVAGGEGRFFAVGVTTGRPGYFIAEPVRETDGTVFGVVVVKIGFSDLGNVLAENDALLLVTDPQGVVLASSQPDLTYGYLADLSAFDRKTLEEQQQFGEQTLFPLDWTSDGGTRAELDGTAYLWTTAQLEKENWTLHLLSEVGDIRRQALLNVAIGMMTILSLVVAAAVYRASQLRQALAISNADRQRLASEIEDRKMAEAKLDKARAELARKNQMAALGQLSASITHELGQPISAMRNYLVAEEISAGATPGAMWPQLSGLVGRMQRIVDQLRSFGRVDEAEAGRFSVAEALSAAVQMVQHTAEAESVSLDVQAVDTAIFAQGHVGRFEQVVVNLLRNAIDAVADMESGQVTVSLTQIERQIHLTVVDNGPGLGDLDITDLSEPFFSTKASGKGMGLGLAISAQIVKDMRGTLHAANQEGAGALFRVTLPASDLENG